MKNFANLWLTVRCHMLLGVMYVYCCGCQKMSLTELNYCIYLNHGRYLLVFQGPLPTPPPIWAWSIILSSSRTCGVIFILALDHTGMHDCLLNVQWTRTGKKHFTRHNVAQCCVHFDLLQLFLIFEFVCSWLGQAWFLGCVCYSSMDSRA